MFVIHDKELFSEDLSQVPYEKSRFDLIRNLFAINLTTLSRVKQTTLLSSDKKKNMLGKATRSLHGRVAQSRMSKAIGLFSGLPGLVPHVVCTKRLLVQQLLPEVNSVTRTVYD